MTPPHTWCKATERRIRGRKQPLFAHTYTHLRHRQSQLSVRLVQVLLVLLL